VVAPHGIAVASSDAPSVVSVPASVDDSGDDDPLHPVPIVATTNAARRKSEDDEEKWARRFVRFMSARSARCVPIASVERGTNGA
jgi:hypothetical protein